MLSLATKFEPSQSAFEKASRAGYSAAEFWSDAELLSRGESIAAIAEEFPFRYAIHFPNYDTLSDEVLQSAATLYQRLNCTALIIHQPMFDRYAPILEKMAPGISLAVENHILDEKGFERWASQNPGLTLDVEHLWKYTLRDVSLPKLLSSVEKFLNRYASKLHHVHLPGYLPGYEEHRPIHHSPQMATEVISMLDSHGYSKLVVSEADITYQTDEFLKKDVLMFTEWLEIRMVDQKR